MDLGHGFLPRIDARNCRAVERCLQLEYRPERVRTLTVNPGVVRTEACLEHLGEILGSTPPFLPAAVIERLAVDPDADAHLGRYLHAQEIAADLGLEL